MYETVVTSILTDFSSLLTLKTNDWASFKDVVVSKTEYFSVNETITACFFISSVSLGLHVYM